MSTAYILTVFFLVIILLLLLVSKLGSIINVGVEKIKFPPQLLIKSLLLFDPLIFSKQISYTKTP